MKFFCFSKDRFIQEREKLYIKKRFLKIFGYNIDFKCPKSFNEHIQCLKLSDRNPRYTKLADKYEVRKYVEGRVGEQFLNELYGAWNSPHDIRFRDLPNQFVLKATHGSSWNIICDDKNKMDIRWLDSQLRMWLSCNYYKRGFEWVYKDIPPMIICEKFLGHEILDFKFFCFNGTPRFIQVDIDRYKNHRRAIYDLQWNLQAFTIHYEQYREHIERPKKLDEMIELASKLSQSIPFVRVDFYSIEDQTIFGEMTFFPGNGFELFDPIEYDQIIGRFFDVSYEG